MSSIPAVSIAVVGAHYPNQDGSNRQFEILLCAPGDPMTLVPEPQNKRDRRAIAVYSEREVQIGYVNAERAGWLGAQMGRREVQAVFQRKASFGALVRIAFDGEAAVLTPTMLVELDEVFDAHKPGADFYPDEVWPDD